jgi:mannitol-1-phosphate/altronate dehydrogenase
MLLRLGDGSMVKLGENGQLQLSELVQRPQQNLLSATLKVLAGAFRFTTEAVQRTSTRRDVTDKVNVAQQVDLLIGVTPTVNLEWVQKAHRDMQILNHRDWLSNC